MSTVFILISVFFSLFFPGISMPTPTSILDLIGGVSQHAMSSGSGMPMVSQQAIYSGAAGSVPQHLISQGKLNNQYLPKS